MNDPDTILQDICQGDEHALRFCVSFYDFLHLLDDLFDQDREVGAEDLGVVTIRALEAFAVNPFFQHHIPSLLPAVRTAIVSWVDSERLRRVEDGPDRAVAEVIKSNYHEVFYTVAGLVGGLDHQMTVTRKYREYDWT